MRSPPFPRPERRRKACPTREMRASVRCGPRRACRRSPSPPERVRAACRWASRWSGAIARPSTRCASPHGSRRPSPSVPALPGAEKAQQPRSSGAIDEGVALDPAGSSPQQRGGISLLPIALGFLLWRRYCMQRGRASREQPLRRWPRRLIGGSARRFIFAMTLVTSSSRRASITPGSMDAIPGSMDGNLPGSYNPGDEEEKTERSRALTSTPTKPSEAAPRASSALAEQIRALPPNEAAALIERAIPSEAVEALLKLNPAIVQSILSELDKGPRRFLAASAPPEVAEQWKRNTQYPKGTIGQMMEAPVSVFSPEMTVGDAVEALRPVVRSSFVTYVYVVDADGKLAGLVTMRDLLFNERSARLADVMLANPFALTPELELSEAMKLTVYRHYPQYPVTDAEGRLVGVVRGASLFELEAFEITALAGSMVGVEKEERVATPITKSFKFRNPWLLLNLLTAFAAGGVVAIFQDTVDRLVILAGFF